MERTGRIEGRKDVENRKLLKNRRFVGKWTTKLSTQLGMLIFATNLMFFSICFSLLYRVIGEVFQNKYEEDCLRRMKQAEYNINNLYDQVDEMSMELISDSTLQIMTNRQFENSSKLILYLERVVRDFRTEMKKDSFIQSIMVWGKNGVVVRCDKSGNVDTNIYYAKEEVSDRYYCSKMYQMVMESAKQPKWIGAYTDQNYGFETEQESEPYISAVRKIGMTFGQLAVNVSMEYFMDIISVDDGVTNNIYVIDEENKIIASRDSETIGTYAVFPEGKENIEGGSKFEIESSHGMMQVLVYYLPALDWSIVEEVPVAEVTRDRAWLRNVLLFSCMFTMSISYLISMWWVSGLITPLNTLTSAVKSVGDGNLGYTLKWVPGNEIGILTKEFNRMSVELKEMFVRNTQVEEEKRTLEMQNLRYQINPHLIYNTLNTIKWMAIINEEESIAESLSLLADFLQPVFRKDSLLCTIREELEYVRNYVAIMNLRVGGNYELKFNLEEKCYDYKIIRFLLQPIVENAILHGLKGRILGEIQISVWAEGKDAWIQIEDDGCGIEQDAIQKVFCKNIELECEEDVGGIGIANVRKRIKNQYGEEYDLTIQKGQEKGTIVKIKFRLETETKNNTKIK